MSSTGEATAHDARSLTLPDWRTAVKRRTRRPRRPSEDEVLLLIGVAFWLVGSILDALDGKYALAGMGALVAGVYWKTYHLMRAHGREHWLTQTYGVIGAALAFATLFVWP